MTNPHSYDPQRVTKHYYIPKGANFCRMTDSLPSHQPGLSKSTFLMGRQCSKLLWFRYNAKDQIPPPDEAQQAVFDQGTEVGELAQQLFPGGMVVAPGIINPSEVIAQTQKAIQLRRPLYEAAFSYPRRLRPHGHPRAGRRQCVGFGRSQIHHAAKGGCPSARHRVPGVRPHRRGHQTPQMFPRPHQ